MSDTSLSIWSTLRCPGQANDLPKVTRQVRLAQDASYLPSFSSAFCDLQPSLLKRREGRSLSSLKPTSLCLGPLQSPREGQSAGIRGGGEFQLFPSDPHCDRVTFQIGSNFQTELTCVGHSAATSQAWLRVVGMEEANDLPVASH